MTSPIDAFLSRSDSRERFFTGPAPEPPNRSDSSMLNNAFESLRIDDEDNANNDWGKPAAQIARRRIALEQIDEAPASWAVPALDVASSVSSARSSEIVPPSRNPIQFHTLPLDDDERLYDTDSADRSVDESIEGPDNVAAAEPSSSALKLRCPWKPVCDCRKSFKNAEAIAEHFCQQFMPKPRREGGRVHAPGDTRLSIENVPKLQCTLLDCPHEPFMDWKQFKHHMIEHQRQGASMSSENFDPARVGRMQNEFWKKRLISTGMHRDLTSGSFRNCRTVTEVRSSR